MRRHSAVAALAVAVLAVTVVPSAWAGPRPFRTRAADDTAWRLIESALARSETVRNLVEQLERSDVIVTVQVCHVTAPALGDTRVVAAAEGTRFLRVRVTVREDLTDQLVVLGHELRHAVEIADAPEVRNAEGQRALGERIGWSSAAAGGYETEAAITAGDAVRRELRRGKVR
jgi:hypothetical protein